MVPISPPPSPKELTPKTLEAVKKHYAELTPEQKRLVREVLGDVGGEPKGGAAGRKIDFSDLPK